MKRWDRPPGGPERGVQAKLMFQPRAPSVSRRSFRSRVSLCVYLCLVPVNHPWIFWGQLRGHRRLLFQSLSSSRSSHPPGVGSWQLWTVPEIPPWGFHKKSQLLRTSKISQTCFLSGALSARRRLHYLSIAACLTSLVAGYHFFTDAFFLNHRGHTLPPSSILKKKNQTNTLHQILVIFRPIQLAVYFLKGQRDRKNWQSFLWVNLKSGDVWNPKQCVEIHLPAPLTASCVSLASQVSQLFQSLGAPQEGGVAWVATLPRLQPHTSAEGLEII